VTRSVWRIAAMPAPLLLGLAWTCRTPPATAAQGAPASLGAPAAGQPEVRAGVVVRPDTVTVGDPFMVIVRVQVPLAARVEWPMLTDTAARIAPRAPVARRDGSSDGRQREEIAEYVVAAWDTGQLATEWPPALVIMGTDTVRVRLADARVFVRSVLSADTAEHVPRPAKPPFAQGTPWWTRWWPALLALAALALVWWWRSRRRVGTVGSPAVPLVGPYERAMAAFDRLERLALSDAGEHGRAVTLSMEIVRSYLCSRNPRTSLAHTSAELLASVAGDTRVPVSALVTLLVGVDAVKYARRPLDAVAARALVADAKALVQQIEQPVPDPRCEPAAAA
jgi:hypothetical protein